MDRSGRDPTRVGRLLVSLARNVATGVRHTVSASDTAAAGETTFERCTVADHVAALVRLSARFPSVRVGDWLGPVAEHLGPRLGLLAQVDRVRPLGAVERTVA